VKSADLLLNSPVLCFIADGAARVAVQACVASIPDICCSDLGMIDELISRWISMRSEASEMGSRGQEVE